VGGDRGERALVISALTPTLSPRKREGTFSISLMNKSVWRSVMRQCTWFNIKPLDYIIFPEEKK
jgi:hypothetical protein